MQTYLQYIVPSQPLEIAFSFIIITITFSNLFLLKLRGTEKNWNKAWINNTESTHDDLDIDHGNVQILSDIVATAPEKSAQIMPGILLVIGLLGTFLGIGMALDKAADVLSTTSTNPADKIQQMMPMLDGLGAKFKTSVFGILGFLVFKAMHALLGTEERRIRWCVIKSQSIFLERKEKSKRESKENLSQILNSLVDFTTKQINSTTEQTTILCAALKDIQNTNTKLSNDNHNKLLQLEQSVITALQPLQGLSHSVKEFSEISKKLNEENSKSATQISDSANNFATSVNQLGPIIVDTFNKIEKSLITTLNQSAKSLQEATTNMSTKLGETINRIESSLTFNMEKSSKSLHLATTSMSDNLSKAIASIEDNFVKNMSNSTQALKETTENMSITLNDSISSMKTSLNDITSKISTSVVELQSNVNNMNLVAEASQMSLELTKGAIQDFTIKIDTQMTSVSKANLLINSSLKEQLPILQNIEKKLSQQIELMSVQSKEDTKEN